ncbi:LuxR C-terminal-related transcriptional regulator [Streptomyces sp. AM 3-1-1]|uniref:LuxR C-terminal-related transcriptional regulator n=1 Tax=Streptomyces sp. AM 3-1-1 TaxID=3028711 RepID=UPI0023B91A53|nr:LuxR C-terminal-related transcriptional regulator [Streptomyces sp. AM 3-1-1]WEH30902.1 LuxR C-terminal-related transcriptional regulator [Streptomyces sp. AM 3-1-1]
MVIARLTIQGLTIQGLTNKAIAARLHLSPHTVNYQLRKIYPDPVDSLPDRSGAPLPHGRHQPAQRASFPAAHTVTTAGLEVLRELAKIMPAPTRGRSTPTNVGRFPTTGQRPANLTRPLSDRETPPPVRKGQGEGRFMRRW